MVAVLKPASVTPQLLRVTESGPIWLVEWRDADGTLLASLYREVCVELYRGEGDERHRLSGTRSDLGYRCADTLADAIGELTTEEIEAITKLDVAPLPREFEDVIAEIVFDPKHHWSKAALRVQVVR